MQNIVITGSSSGIGFGLAGAFLSRGCRVVVSSHNTANLDGVLRNCRSIILRDPVLHTAAT
nr:SDR family NAD(P)-dependent oxidoreductase [Chlorobium phaeovibrioides]